MSGEQFANYLVNQTPVYDKEILRDVRPTDGEIGHFETGSWDSFTNTTHVKDRFNVVFPNLTKRWRAAPDGSCVGTPCDIPQSEIGWGNTRVEYSREQISYRTQLLCFDDISNKTAAKENFQQIISDILKPSTNFIVSDFAKRKASELAGAKWLADATQSSFTFTFENNGDDSIYMTTSGEPTSKLTPQMLRRRFNRLAAIGYFGKMVDRDMPPWIELVTDNDTLYGMVEGDSAILRVEGGSPVLASTQWRFQEFDNVGKFWKYGWSGKIGNYVTRVDFFPLRFNKVSTNRFQRVLPYKNIAATNGLKDEWNTDYEKARYQFSRIHHRRGMRILTKTLSPISPDMPFMNRSLAGQWRFAMNNLGDDCNGVGIANYRGNKGFFWADFDMAAEPLYTEWMELIFHLREPDCITTVTTCGTDPGYPTQNYDSANDACSSATNVVYITPVASASGDYELAASTVTVNGVPIVHTAVSGQTTLAALVTALNLNVNLKFLGTWAVAGNNTQITLTGSNGATLVLPWILT
jgi:hypothetical protein